MLFTTEICFFKMAVVEIKILKWTLKRFYYYERSNPHKKPKSRFTIGRWGHRLLNIGKYEIALWKVKKLPKKKISEEIKEIGQVGILK